MEQATLIKHGREPNPLDTTGLCLLSLDGGGVRGLSTLYILKGLMDRLNHELKKDPPMKPCEVFDLIGGTSTGGLIAIMLGRLKMDVDECIAAYTGLMKTVFETKSGWLPASWTGKVRSRFDAAKLETAIKEVITSHGAKETDLFNDGAERGCRVFVCTIAHETKDIIRLRSYDSGKLPIRATIVQAALATSAATTFFDPVTIGARKFADGGLGANNPVDEVEGEASDIWCSETGDLKPLVKCFVSIGTGNPGKKAIEDNMLKFLSGTLVDLATQTENTEKRFIGQWRKHFDEKRYFRFNVDQGLQDVGLAEYQERGAIEAATDGYLDHQGQQFRVRDCIQNLRLKKSTAATNFVHLITEYNEQRTIALRIGPQVETPWIVPFQRNPHFVGRSAEIAQVDATFSSETRCERVAIIGLGGVGKTQIALEYAHRLRERQPDCSVFWIPVTSVESMLQAYLEIGQQLQIPNLEQEKADVQELVQNWLNQENSGRWLLVFDNADNMDIWMDKPGSIPSSGRRIDYLPKSKHGSILFTTRSRKAATKLAGKNVVLVGEMDETIAKDLMEKSLTDPDLLADGGATTDLLQKLTHLPLAIVQAAAYINENNITLAKYTALLDDTERNKIELLSEEFEDEGRYEDSKNPVATTWLISFEQIRNREPLAAEYLSFMSCVDAKDIPQSLLPPAESAKRAVDAIGTLTAYSFVTKQKTGQLLDLHRLVHLATRNWLRMENSLKNWTARAIKRLEEVFPESDQNNRSIWRLYLPHARYVLKTGLEDEDAFEVTELLWKFGNCVYHDGKYGEAVDAFVKVLETRKRTLGMEHPLTAAAMNSTANALAYMGQFARAVAMFEEALEKRRSILGEEHLDTISTMNDLAFTLGDQGKLDEASAMTKEVLEKRKLILGETHLDTISAMCNLAVTLRAEGKADKAAEVMTKVVERRRCALGDEHLDTIAALSNLANVLGDQGKFDKAIAVRKEVMEKRKRILGDEHPETIAAINNLAITLGDQGNLDDATAKFKEVEEKRRNVFGDDHPDTISATSNLATAMLDQGKTNEAMAMFEAVLDKRKCILGDEHPVTISAMSNLALTLGRQGKFDEAMAMAKEVVEKRTYILGEEHPDTMSALNILGVQLQAQGKLDQAEAILQDVLAKRKRILGEEHPHTLSTMNNLANTFGEQGRYSESARILEQVLQKRRRTLGEEHPATISAMNNLAVILGNQGRLDEAVAIKKEVFKKRTSILGKEHPDTISALNNLGATLRDLGKINEAVTTLEEAVEMSTCILGNGNRETIVAMSNLALALGEQGKLDDAVVLSEEVLEKGGRILGDDHPIIISAVNNLATLLYDQGKFNEAMKTFQEVFQKRRYTLGNDHPDTISSMSNIALTLQGQGKLDEAVALCKEALELRKRILGKEHADTISSLSNLALGLRSQGKLDEAQASFEEVLEIRSRILGNDHPDTISAISNLALNLGDQGKLDEAAIMKKHVLEKMVNILGAEHPKSITAMSNLAITLWKQKKSDEAAAMLTEVLERRHRILGDDHLDTISTMNSLAAVHEGQGNVEHAVALKKQVLEKRRHLLGEEHPDSILTLHSLANTLGHQGKLDDASAMLKEALEKMTAIFGKHDPKTSLVNEDLATVRLQKFCISLGSFDNVASHGRMIQRQLQEFEEDFGQEHKSTLVVVSTLGQFYESLGELAQAEEMYQRSLYGCTKILGPVHPSTLKMVDSLGNLYIRQSKVSEAERMFSHALQDCQDTLGLEHAATVSAVRSLYGVYYRRCYELRIRQFIRWSPNFSHPDTARELRLIILDLVRLCDVAGIVLPALFGLLGRTLVWAEQETDAHVAFAQQIGASERQEIYGDLRCDGCATDLNIETGRLICKVCLDTELCRQCHRNYEIEGRLYNNNRESCQDHSFLAIPRDGWLKLTSGTVSRDNTSLKLWLDNIRSRTRASIQESTMSFKGDAYHSQKQDPSPEWEAGIMAEVEEKD